VHSMAFNPIAVPEVAPEVIHNRSVPKVTVVVMVEGMLTSSATRDWPCWTARRAGR